MKVQKALVLSLCALASVTATAQKWAHAYQEGLEAAKRSDWAKARERFLDAIADRPQDSASPSTVGSSVLDRQPWRNGSPYSPNFAAAYCSFKLAATSPDGPVRKQHLETAISGFNTLINGGQESIESLLFLAAAYAAANDTSTSSKVQERLNKVDPAKSFKVDREVLEFADLRVLQGTAAPGEEGTGIGRINDILNPAPGDMVGVVPVLDYKFALIVGNNTASGGSFGAADANLIRSALMRHGGYAESNIVVLTGATSDQIAAAADQLSSRMPENGTILIFYSGNVHTDENGRDYLVGTEGGKGILKTELFQRFVSKAASVFSFFQVDRPVGNSGVYFGRDVPAVGKIAQCIGTAPGERTQSAAIGGETHGVYAAAFAEVLGEVRNNRIPILDFAWELFYKVRSGASQAGGLQTPTLPVLASLDGAARF